MEILPMEGIGESLRKEIMNYDIKCNKDAVVIWPV